MTLFEAAGGLDGLRRLAAAWHRRVLDDEEVSHAFRHGFRPDHTDRLAAYWAEALGGPAAYSSTYGDETSVVRLHSGNGLHDEMNSRAIACFDQALTDTGLDRSPEHDPRLRQALPTTSPGPPTPPCTSTTAPPTTSPPASPSPAGPGTGS